MANSAAPLMNIFGTTDHLIPLILDDLSDAESRVRARGDDGPSIAWHLGHLLSYRHQGLQLLGQADDNPYVEAFERSPATDGRDYPTTTELSEQWSRVSTRFLGSHLIGDRRGYYRTGHRRRACRRERMRQDCIPCVS